MVPDEAGGYPGDGCRGRTVSAARGAAGCRESWLRVGDRRSLESWSFARPSFCRCRPAFLSGLAARAALRTRHIRALPPVPRRPDCWCWSTRRIGPSHPRLDRRDDPRPTRCMPSSRAGDIAWPVVIAWSGWSAPVRRLPASVPGGAGRRGAGKRDDRGAARKRQGACCQGDPLSPAAGADRRCWCRWLVRRSTPSC